MEHKLLEYISTYLCKSGNNIPLLIVAVNENLDSVWAVRHLLQWRLTSCMS